MTVNRSTIDEIENRRKRLIFRSWHRGTKEMDLLLGSFADRYVSGFSVDELQLYEDVLELSDPDLYNWITGQEAAPANVVNAVFERLKVHTFA